MTCVTHPRKKGSIDTLEYHGSRVSFRKTRFLSRRVVELAAPKSRKYADGTYDLRWANHTQPIKRIPSAALRAKASERTIELSEPRKKPNVTV